MFDEIHDLVTDLETQLERWTEFLENESFKGTTRQQRSALRVRFNTGVADFSYGEEGILIRSLDLNSWNYYMGFEYIEKVFVETLGDYIFFSSEDERVQGVIAFLQENEENEEDDAVQE